VVEVSEHDLLPRIWENYDVQRSLFRSYISGFGACKPYVWDEFMRLVQISFVEPVYGSNQRVFS